MKNYYQILEVNENASPEVIEKAYRVLAKKYHPDTYPKDKAYWAESKFKEITEAYNVLSNSYTRSEYDAKMGFNNYSYQNSNFNKKTYQEQNNSNTKSEKESNKTTPISYVKKYISSFATLIYNETKKPKEERSKDMIALVLTIIIVTIIVIVFWKVPFLKNIIFP